MSEILAGAVALPTLAVAVLVWGLLPGFVNRLFARIYPADDPRRRDMVAELYAVPRWEQPLWVAQQAERAISEGIPARARKRRSRMSKRDVRVALIKPGLSSHSRLVKVDGRRIRTWRLFEFDRPDGEVRVRYYVDVVEREFTYKPDAELAQQLWGELNQMLKETGGK